MNNVATVRKPRLNATVWGDLLSDHIRETDWALPVQYKSGDLALKIDHIQARALIRHKMIAGLVRNGYLRYIVLLVPKATVVRVLHMDPPRAGEITRRAISDSNTFSQYVDIRQAKLGRVARFQKMRSNNYERVRLPLPGTTTPIDRRVVA